jgi:uncharacterized protein (DUF2267 family)
MAETGLAAFDTTLQKTNTWLQAITVELGPGELGPADRQRAYSALRATLHALRDRMPVTEAVELAAQLPMLVRGLFFVGWRPSATPSRERTKQAFLRHIAASLRTVDLDFPEAAARAVFKVLAAKVTEGEIENVRHLLPSEIRALWPDDASSRHESRPSAP